MNTQLCDNILKYLNSCTPEEFKYTIDRLLNSCTPEELKRIIQISEMKIEVYNQECADDYLKKYIEAYRRYIKSEINQKPEIPSPNVTLDDGKSLTEMNVGHFLDHFLNTDEGQKLIEELGYDFISSLFSGFYNKRKDPVSFPINVVPERVKKIIDSILKKADLSSNLDKR